MKSKFIKWTFVAVFILVFFVACKYFQQFEIIYVKLFKISISLTHKNSEGQLDGEAVLYKGGIIRQIAHFHNGLKEGLMTRFYAGGQVQNKIFYKNGKEDGCESEYYENGTLHYQGTWKKGKRFGGLFYYDDNGNLKVYHAYDIVGEKFNIIRYDTSGICIKHDGFVVSNVIYSLKSNTDSVVILKKNNSYDDIGDLYLTVAVPPHLHASIDITINGIKQTKLSLKDNTIKIPDIFEKAGVYNIVIKEQLMDKNYKVLEASSFVSAIIKK